MLFGGSVKRRIWISAVGGLLAAGSLSPVLGGAGPALGAVAGRADHPAVAPTGAVARTGAAPQARRSPAYLTYVLDVACVTGSVCYAVGGTPWNTAAAAKTTDGGARWQTVTVPNGLGGLSSVSCSTTSDCVAVGRDQSGNGLAIATTNGGRSWALHPITGAAFPASVSCPTASTCFAAGGGRILGGGPPAFIAVTHDDGKVWTEQDSAVVGYWNRLEAISCVSSSRCWTVGEGDSSRGQVLATVNGGRAWTTSVTQPEDVTGIDCTDATQCFGLTAAGVIVTVNGGATWRREKVPSAVSALGSISCVAGGLCWVVGVNVARAGPVIITNKGGSSWSVVKFSNATNAALATISCPTRVECVLAGGTKRGFADVFTTGDGGLRWRQESLPNGVDYLRTGTCLTADDCWVAGATSTGVGAVLVTTNGGTSWRTVVAPPSTYILYDVSCESSSECMAVGITAHGSAVLIASSNAGSTWSPEPLPSGTASLVGVTCWAASDCIAVGTTTSGQGAVIVSSDGGKQWTSESDQLPVGSEYLNSVVCPSAGTCVVAGGTASSSALIVTTSDGGTTWTAPTLPSHLTVLYSVSCPSTSTCWAAGSYVTTLSEAGAIIGSSDGGQTWSLEPTSPEVQSLDGVACAGPSDCTAVGAAPSGNSAVMTTTDGGTSWAANTPATVGPLNGVIAAGASRWWAFGTTLAGGAIAWPKSVPTAAVLSAVRHAPTPVPAGFHANSMSWTSPTRAFVLGQASCGAKQCTDVIGTSDGGTTWALLGRVPAPIARPSPYAPPPGVAEIRAANARTAFAFDPEFFRTTDGGHTWAKAPMPPGARQVLSVARNSKYVFIATSECAFNHTCSEPYTLWRSASPSSNSWTRVPLTLPRSTGARITTAGTAVYVDDPLFGADQPDRLFASTDSGQHFARRAVPCAATDTALIAVAASSSLKVAVLCEGSSAKGAAEKAAYLSTNAGLTFASAGTLPADGIEAEMAISSTGVLLVPTWSIGSFLDLNSGGTTWTNVATEGNSGGWNDPTFVSSSEGFVIFGPPNDSQVNVGTGELLVTHDAGQHWSQVQFR